MKLFGLAGWSGSGKTTLLTALLPLLIRRGLRVSTVKHVHHSVDLDQPGKDTHRHRLAGATEVALISASRWTLMHELREEPEPSPADLLQHMTPVDLVLIEGFKHGAHAPQQPSDQISGEKRCVGGEARHPGAAGGMHSCPLQSRENAGEWSGEAFHHVRRHR